MSSIVVAAIPVAGHAYPLLQIGRALREAGHDVTFVGGTRFLARAEQFGLRTCPLTGRADYDDRRMAEEFPDIAGMPPGLERLNLETRQFFGDSIPDQHEALQGLLRERPDSTLITDILFAGAFPARCGVGVRPKRWISVGVAPLYVRSVDTSPFGPVPVEPGADQAAANLAAFDAFSGALQPAYDHIREVVASLGGTVPVPDWVSALYAMPDLTAQLSVPEFEFPRGDLPASVHYVGIIPPDSRSWERPSWWSELDDGRPVVLVTQGTLANDDLGELVAPTLAALAEDECLVIAALGRPVEDLDAAVPPNARVVEYVPFDRLLPAVDVLVTNGGYGGTQQALAAGVPAVVAGASEDKPATAARVAFHGVGLDLATQTPTPDAVASAVRAVLGDPGYRERTAELAHAYPRYDAPALIEQLVRQP